MPTIPESGPQITLPDGMYFRFQDIPEYKRLSGSHLKEMDFGWWDCSEKRFWLLEVKDYSLLPRNARLPGDLLTKLEMKVVDSLIMLGAMWSGTTSGQKFRNHLPEPLHSFPLAPPRTDARIMVVIVLKVDKRHIISDLPPLKDELNARLRGRISLFDIRAVHLWDHNTAKKLA